MTKIVELFEQINCKLCPVVWHIHYEFCQSEGLLDIAFALMHNVSTGSTSCNQIHGDDSSDLS